MIISDNSKTFKSADMVIAEILNRPEIEEFIAGVRIKGNFNLEKAPWWGGFFERLVKSTKRCLKIIIGTTRLSYEELQKSSSVMSPAKMPVVAHNLSPICTSCLDNASAQLLVEPLQYLMVKLNA